jgi:hypothetical protein
MGLAVGTISEAWSLADGVRANVCGRAHGGVAPAWGDRSEVHAVGRTACLMTIAIPATYYAAAFLAAAFLGAAFLAVAFLTSTRPAFFAAQRFFNAATIAALPAALSLRLGMAVALDIVPAPLFASAHRLLCASPMRFRVAALIFLRGCVCGSDVVVAGL